MAVRKDFGLTYRDKDNSNKATLRIQRAPLGTHERFIGGSQSPASSRRRLHAGSFPLWLAPDQVRVLTLNDDDEALIKYAKPIVAELRANMVRVDADFSATPFKAKISNAERSGSHPPPHVVGYGWLSSVAIPQGAKPKAEVVADILASIKERRA